MIEIQDFGFAKKITAPAAARTSEVLTAYAKMQRGCDVLHTNSQAHVQAIVDWHSFAIVAYCPRRGGWMVRKRSYA